MQQKLKWLTFSTNYSFLVRKFNVEIIQFYKSSLNQGFCLLIRVRFSIAESHWSTSSHRARHRINLKEIWVCAVLADDTVADNRVLISIRGLQQIHPFSNKKYFFRKILRTIEPEISYVCRKGVWTDSGNSSHETSLSCFHLP